MTKWALLTGIVWDSTESLPESILIVDEDDILPSTKDRYFLDDVLANAGEAEGHGCYIVTYKDFKYGEGQPPKKYSKLAQTTLML